MAFDGGTIVYVQSGILGSAYPARTGYVNLTPAGDSFVSATVTGLSWVTAASILAATVIDHPSGASAEEAAAEGCVATIGNIVAGTGFDVYLNIPGGGLGPYRVGYVGG